MKIKHLPQHLQQLALKEAELQGFKWITVEADLMEAFNWSSSTQEGYFWCNIYNGNFNTDEP